MREEFKVYLAFVGIALCLMSIPLMLEYSHRQYEKEIEHQLTLCVELAEELGYTFVRFEQHTPDRAIEENLNCWVLNGTAPLQLY